MNGYIISSLKLSAVLPVYNEEDNLPILLNSLIDVLENLKCSDYQIVLVDDGSTDKSRSIMEEFEKNNEKTILIKFRRNYGQTAALHAGIDNADGDLIVTLDSDIQNDPSDIRPMLELMEATGADVISGWRYPRIDPFPRRIVSIFANIIISKICKLKLHDYGCTLKLYKTKIIKELNLFGEMHRFIPAFISWNGGIVKEIKVKHNPRTSGKTSYGMDRIHRVILDLITTKLITEYLTKPNHVFGSFGLINIILGLACGVYVVLRRGFMGGEWLSPLFFLSVFLFGLGVIMIMLGIIAEIAVRIYFSRVDKKPYMLD
ncbi:glycosyltransferase family 2 protein [Elusimicrobiota bacterium]